MRVPREGLGCGGHSPMVSPGQELRAPLRNALPPYRIQRRRASALQTSPPLLMPPSVTIGRTVTFLENKHHAQPQQSTVAVTCGTPGPKHAALRCKRLLVRPNLKLSRPHSMISSVRHSRPFPDDHRNAHSRQNFSKSSDYNSDEMCRRWKPCFLHHENISPSILRDSCRIQRTRCGIRNFTASPIPPSSDSGRTTRCDPDPPGWVPW